LTSIKLLLNGAHAWATVDGPLTSGMVGIPVTIEYDESWDGLTKNLMCRCSPWGSNNGEIRSILDVGETATVAHEVMQPDMFLHLGIEGFNEDGTLVIPTTWARCGKIEYGANTCEDPSTNPELSVWNQLQVEMEKTKAYVLTPEQAVNIQSYAQTATQAAQEARQAAEEAKQTVGSGLYYIPSVSQPTDTTLKFEFKPSVTGVPVPKPVTVTLPVGEGSGENVTQGGLSAAAKAALMAVVESIAVFTVDNPQELIANLRNAMYDAPVASISAVYTQTRTVYASDALDVLRDDLVVTATYTDGSSAVRTDYTLSGTLTAGTSVVTATLDGKTATFDVTVAAARIPATGITLSSESINITAGDPVQLVATVEPADSTDTVVWTSSEEAVATVAQDGTVTPVASGSCTITATAGDVSAECAVTVAMPLTGYNYGNPYLNFINSDPTTLGKTDEDLRGKWYSGMYNTWGNALGVNNQKWFLYPFGPGTHYIRYVNRIQSPPVKFYAFANADIVANPTATLGEVGASGSGSNAAVTKRSSFDCELNDNIGRPNIGQWTTVDSSAETIDDGFLMLFELTVPDGEYVFMTTTEASQAARHPGYSDKYPLNDWYTVFQDDPSGNILQIAREVQA